MGIFGKKNKQEVINIKPITEDIIEDKIDILESKESKSEIAEEYTKNLNQMKDDALKIFSTIQSRNEKVTNEYYICRILSRVGLKDLDFNLQLLALDKNINRLKKECFDINRRVNRHEENEEIETLFKQVNELWAFQKGLQEQLKEINNSSYGYLKISTVSVCLNKTNEELEHLHNCITEELKPFKSFNEAAEYIYYNSGDFIDKLVKQLVDYIKLSNNSEYINLYTIRYFLPSDIVVTMEIKEWIDFYNRLKFVNRQIGSYNALKLKNYKNMFDIFEAKYAILMMKSETKNSRKY